MSQPIKDKIILFLHDNAIWIAIAVVVLILLTLLFFYFYNRKNIKNCKAIESPSVDEQQSIKSSSLNEKKND